MTRFGPFDVTTETGEPVRVDSHELAPIVRVVKMRRLESVVSATQQRVSGFVVLLASPIAVQVRDDQGEHTVPVTDPTRRATSGVLASLIVIPLLSLLVARLAAHRIRA